jgi:putative FmdB family regulatory protein
MPTYEYRCVKGHQFDVFQKMSDDPVATCPECGERAERMLSGGAGVLFKGEGFYITDYRGADYKKKAEAERSGSVDAAPDKGKTKTDTGSKSSSGESKSDSGKSKSESKSSGSSSSGGGSSSDS